VTESVTDIRVVVVDDHQIVREGLSSLLGALDGIEVVGSAADGRDAVHVVAETAPDVVVMDIQMPQLDGIEATRMITGRQPGTRVVMLTMNDDDETVLSAIRAGASGYLLKDMDPDRVSHALEGVLAGEAALPRTLLLRVMDEFRDRGKRRLRLPGGRKGADLSDREWEVLNLLRDGMSTQEIATRLYVSAATVRSHVASILKKLRVPDREAAIRLLDETD
jgi:DNA-binding NarL/FixJ family response regulator